MEEGKIGCNHLVIAGILTQPDYAKADFLAMHLEQHMRFEIQRHGKLPEQWDEYYQNVLVPLGITGDDIKAGKTVIYTREGRVVGSFDDFQKLMKVKYNVSVNISDDWIAEILQVHEEKAKMAIDDAKDAEFNERVDAFLKKRQESMDKMASIIEEHKNTIEKTENAAKEIDSIIAYLKPTTEALYALHHYPVKEEETEQDAPSEEQPQDESAESQETESEEPQKEAEEPAKEAEDPPKEEEPHKEEEAAAEKPKEEEEEGAEKPAEEEKPKEEEEEQGEPDPEAIELQGKLAESYKLPEIEGVKALIQEGDNNGLSDFITELDTLFQDSKKLVEAERFKWKKFEKIILEINEKATLASNMLRISIISAEQLKVKAVEDELDKYDNFIIDGIDKDVLEAGAIKFAATFRFV